MSTGVNITLLGPIYCNPIMFMHDLCHSQIENFSIRLVDPEARRGLLSIYIEKKERHAAQAPALHERYNKSFHLRRINIQFRHDRVGGYRSVVLLIHLPFAHKALG